MRGESAVRAEIVSRLRALSEDGYRKFNASLIPGKENILGVRLPALRAYAKELSGDFREVFEAYGIRPLNAPDFSEPLPSERFLEEDLLCGILLSRAKTDFSEFAAYVRGFVPRIDNWSVCDCTVMGLKSFGKRPEEAWELISPYFGAPGEYGVRVAVVSLLAHFASAAWLERGLRELETLSDGRLAGKYYAQMAVAWAYSIYWVKFPVRTRAELEKIADPLILKKTISKTCESYRVSDADKAFLREYRKNNLKEEKI